MTNPRFVGMHEAYPYLQRQIMTYGEDVSPRGEATRELLGVTFEIEDAVRFGVPLGLGRKVGIKMQAIDGTGNLACESYPDVAIRLAPVMDRFADDMPGIGHADRQTFLHRQPFTNAGERFLQGAYGPRIHGQMVEVERQLRSDPATRQAVVNLWSETDRNPLWNDRPCTTQFQLMIRKGRLDMHVSMRANDLWTGTCYDVFQFGQIQAAMAHVLGIPYGTYYHHATSLHIYHRDFEKFAALEPTDNPRESWGPDWARLEPGTYTSWGHLQDRFDSLLWSAHEKQAPAFDPDNEVEGWYWDVIKQAKQ